jgi:hypothetical protein
MRNSITQESFLRDVEKHKMTIIRDNGVDRHVRFKKPNTNEMYFDLITWDGYLTITGDMGTYVYSRLNDMFEFFRTEQREKDNNLHINVSYWSEKLQAVNSYGRRPDAPLKFSPDRFKEAVRQAYKGYSQYCGKTPEEKRELREQIRNEVYHAEDEHESVQAIRDFHHDDFDFCDFWEYCCEEYTDRYIWTLYAIAWGIREYDRGVI